MTDRWLVHAEHATRIVTVLAMGQPVTICYDATDNIETLLYPASFISTDKHWFVSSEQPSFCQLNTDNKCLVLGNKLCSFYLDFQSNQ